MMESNYQEFAERFAQKMADGEFQAAHALFFAPSLRASVTPEKLKQDFENQLRELGEGFDIAELIYPKEFEISGNSCTLEDLQALDTFGEPRIFHPEITPENFRKWMVIQFLPDEDEELELDAWMDWWMLVMELNGELKIGYYEIQDPD